LDLANAQFCISFLLCYGWIFDHAVAP
jgi:hypothetical protein